MGVATLLIGCHSNGGHDGGADAIGIRDLGGGRDAALEDGGADLGLNDGGNADGAMAMVTDAQIAAIVQTANTGEIRAAQVAVATTANTQVKGFAQMMINDHGMSNQQLMMLLTQIGITPMDSPISMQLMQHSMQEVSMLQGLMGAAFDRAYMDAQVSDHQMVLDLLDNTLIPQARNAQLKSFLQTARTTVAAHLDMAKKLRANLP